MSDLYYNNRPVHGNRKRRKKTPSNRKRVLIIITAVLLAAAIIAAVIACVSLYRRYLDEVAIPEHRVEHMYELEGTLIENTPHWIEKRLIDINGRGRTGEPLEAVRDIVIHYIGNPGTGSEQNWAFFNTPDTGVSSDFIVGLEGEIIQCLPLYERSQASNERNRDTISIEVCHPDDTGQFTEASNEALVRLVAWLIEENGLDISNVIRHYDITGKECPRYHVRHPEAWTDLLTAISFSME